MNKQQHPFEAIIEWYDSLPPDLRQTVSIMALMLIPELVVPEGTMYEDAGEALLRRWLSPEQRRANDVVGKALTFRAIIDFKGRNFFSKERQVANDRMRAGLAEQFRENNDPEFAAKFAHSNEQSPLRNAHWTKAGESWKRLCASALSDAALEEYEALNPPYPF